MEATEPPLDQHCLLDHIHRCETCAAQERCAAFVAMIEALSNAYYAAAEAKRLTPEEDGG